jgi:hypothetical protein
VPLDERLQAHGVDVGVVVVDPGGHGPLLWGRTG